MADTAQTQTPAAEATESVKFLSVAEFKKAIGQNSISVLRNPNTQKLWMVTEDGHNYKVQQDIDQAKDIRVLVPEDGGLEQACLVNVEGGAETIFAL